MGDAMADWLGHGLEEAYADNPEFGVVRKIRANSGLLRNESRTNSYDWVQSAREAQEKADFVVILLGLSDRQPIRERQAARAAQQPAQAGQQPADQQPSGTHEFRSEKWGELYAKRIDDMIAAAKSKGVPVLWVGLPPIRGARAKIDLTYLNDIYKASAQKAGVTYVDVWDGFADEDGNFSLRGPDYNGQIRQLRSADGVYFTKAGALKLGHYVEREIQRLIADARTAGRPAGARAVAAGAHEARRAGAAAGCRSGRAADRRRFGARGAGGRRTRAGVGVGPDHHPGSGARRGRAESRRSRRRFRLAASRPRCRRDHSGGERTDCGARGAAACGERRQEGRADAPAAEQRKAAPKRPGPSAAAAPPQPAPFAFPQNPFQLGPSPARPPR